MSLIITENVYVWCNERQCVGVLDSRHGCGTLLNIYWALDEMLCARLPADSSE